MSRWGSAWVAALCAVAALTIAAPAQAFDTGPHQEMTWSALQKEGFGVDATEVVQVDNWFTDLYHELSSGKIPYSGHSGLKERLLLLAPEVENWPSSLVAASTRSHFDNWPGVPAEAARPDLNSAAGVAAEWDRLRRSVGSLVREARDNDDPEMLLAVLGISLHEVQDFYTHTDWIEPFGNTPGKEGPGWTARGFGSYPTYFDIPVTAREQAPIYGDNTPGHPRPHGLWNADDNRSLTTAMNKDWPGRPYFLKAAITAYFASRQWIEAVRSWVGDDAFWASAQAFQANHRAIDHDLEGRFRIMLYSGHWQGQGEPFGGDASGAGGSLIELRQAVKKYFQKSVSYAPPGKDFGKLYGKTPYRARFEQILPRVADPNASGEVGQVPSSQPIQHAERIVVLRIPWIKGEGLGDPGPDQADMYARVGIDGQGMRSAVINGEDSFNFPAPYAPFTWFKAVPAAPEEAEPLKSVEVELRTADVRWAGTDDNVFVRLAPGLRFEVGRRLKNDFERGDRTTYSVPIDSAVEAGLTVGDITQVGIEKSPDRLAGGWKLGGVRLFVNGRVRYDNIHVDRWLEDNHRVWTAPNFHPIDPHTTGTIPIWMTLGEDDMIYGGDDDGDVNPYDNRRVISFDYPLGQSITGSSKGGHKLGGRWGDGNEASLDFKVETLTPELMHGLPSPPVQVPPQESPPTKGPKLQLDLLITEFTANGLTIRNTGPGTAGPFRVRIGNNTIRPRFKTFPGLGPNQTVRWQEPGLSCAENYIATVDDLEQVEEANETNNNAEAAAILC